MPFRFVQPPRFSVLSTRYVKCWISVSQSGSQIDPTSGTVEFAFMATNATPGESDWKTGTWESTPFEYLGRCLVGPDGTVALSAGSYDVWVRYTKAPETVVEEIGSLTIY
jgi:hypothetical protein